MSGAPNAQANSAAAIEQKIEPNTYWRIVSITVLDGYKLKVRFMDGLEGEVRMEDFLMSSTAGVFTSLRDRRLFDQVFLRWGAVTWPGELDLAPDAMYDDIKSTGVCIVGSN